MAMKVLGEQAHHLVSIDGGGVTCLHVNYGLTPPQSSLHMAVCWVVTHLNIVAKVSESKY